MTAKKVKTAEDWRHVFFSPNFTGLECLRSQTADRHGLSEQQYNPPPEVVKNLRHNCGIAQGARNYFGQLIHTNSGYRCDALDLALKGYIPKTRSAHTIGQALDLELFDEAPGAFDSLVDRIYIECGVDVTIHKPAPNFYLFAYFALRSHDQIQQLISEFGESIWAPAWVHLASRPNGPNRGRLTRAAVETGEDGTPERDYRHYSNLREFLETEIEIAA